MLTEPQSERINPAEAWHEVAAIALVLMELTWLAFWFAILFDQSILGAAPASPLRADSFWRAFVVLGVVYAGGYALARLLNILDVKIGFRRAAFAALVLLSLWLSLGLLARLRSGAPAESLFPRVYHSFLSGAGVPAEFWVLVAVALAWWRAASLARSVVDLQTVLLSFQFGILSLLLSEFFPPQVIQAVGFHPIFVFVFLGLVSMGAARIADINGLRGSKLATFNRAWMAALAGGALLVVAAGALLAALLNGWLGRQIGLILLVVMSILGGLTLVVITPLVQLLLNAFQFLQQQMGQWEAFAPMLQMMEQIQKWSANQGATALETIERASRPLALWGLLVALVLAAVFAIRLRNRLASSARQRGQVKVTPQDLLKGLAEEARLSAQEALETLARRLNLRQAARLIQAARIRWVYRQLEALCAELGSPRPAAQTPLEFLTRLQDLFPTAPQPLEEITGAYLKVRYGELPETGEDVNRVIGAWETVRALGQQELARRKKNPK